MNKFFRRVCIAASCGVLTLAFFCGCANGETEPTEDERVVKPDTETSILLDRDFSQGFNLLGMDAGIDGRNVYRTLDYGGTADGASPVWEMSQWQGKNNLVEAEEVKEGDTYTYQAGGKKFVYDQKNAAITLAIDAEQEYDAPRENGQGWVHILIEQNFQTVYSVEDVSSIYVSLDFCLTEYERKMTDEEYDRNLHNAQLLWYITLTNMPPADNPLDESGYPVYGASGDYIWFGIPIVDYTSFGEFMDKGLSYDAGTAHWICSLDSAEYLDRPVELNVRKSFKYDILPMFREVLAEVQGAGGMRNCSYENLYVTYMNFGWEVPGTFDVSVDIYDIGIDAVTK